MAKVLSSISGNLISAASAGYAPTNSADVSAIASAYQVVSATGTQLYAGTAHVTSINGDPISASRAGNAANASLATSAYYDGTGRLISSLPDAATVSSIASSYAESAASGKLDTSEIECDTASAITAIGGSSIGGAGGVVTSTGSAEYVYGGIYGTGISGINESGLIAVAANSADSAKYALSAEKFTWGARAISVAGSVRLGGNDDSVDSVSGGTGAGVFLSGSFGTAYYKVNELVQNRGGTGQIKFNIGGSGSQITVSSNAGGKFSACGTGNTVSYYSAFNDSASAGINASDKKAILTLGTPSSRARLSAYSSGANLLLSGNDTQIVLRDSATSATAYPSSFAAWDSTYNTVSSNSASWGGGGGGSYVETSAMEVEIGSSNTASSIGFAQGSANSARNTAFAQGRGNNIAYTSFGQGILNAAYSYSLAQGANNSADIFALAQGELNQASGTSFSQGSFNTAGSTSFAQGNGNVVSSCSFAQGIINTAYDTSFTHGFGNSAINKAVVFGEYNLSGDGDTATGNSAAFAIGDGTAHNARHDLMLVTKDGEITMYSSTADTTGTGIMSAIRAISAAATGGVDSATVSAIASGYASGKADSSALSSYALSADVSSTVDVVSTQSANWGGSALALSAGPGITFTKSGNTLVAGLDETLLWSGSIGDEGDTASLSESIENFSHVSVYAIPVYGGADAVVNKFETRTGLNACKFGTWSQDGGATYLANYNLNVSGNSAGLIRSKRITINHSNGVVSVTQNSVTGTYMAPITKIVGINRTANN